jgi:hypothetical protein
MGEPLFGPLITRTQIEENLILIGQDCECDLERSVLRGRRVLLTWDDDHRSAAQRTLEFDPENPLVRAEVSRILSRGREEKGTSQGSSSTDYLESEIPRVSDDKGKTPNSSASASVERGMSGLYLVLGAFIGVTLFGAVWLLVRRGSAF